MRAEKPREIAARVLQRHGHGSDWLDALVEEEVAGAALAPADRALVQELTFGVVRWQATLDWLIARKTQGRTQKAGLQDLLRLGLYQIFWLDRIPAHAAVHETVEQAKQNGFGPQAGLINAVLRGCLREFDATKKQLADLKTTQPALGWSHPEWLVERWRNQFGEERTRRLLEWNNTPPKTFVRVNTLKTTAEKLLPQWRDENVDYDFFTRDWTGENLVFELRAYPSLLSLKSFRDGGFYVQDPSTLLAVRELDPQPCESVLDLCAAPGGKTMFIAQLMRNEGRVVAYDTSPERLKLVQGNCARLGVTCVEAVSTPRSALRTPHFDKVLVDAPCSNTGVLRRRVDLRWRLKPEEIARLRGEQLALLQHAAPRVKPGGILVYSTCSLESEENSEAVKEFLNANQQFRLGHQRELLPFADNVDGAFVARLERLP